MRANHTYSGNVYTITVNNALLFFTGFLSVAQLTPVAANLTHLPVSAKLLLTAMPSFGLALSQIPMGKATRHADGGKRTIRLLQFFSLMGSALIAINASYSNNASITSMNTHYWAYAVGGILSGLGGGLFQQLSNTIQFATHSQYAKVQAVHGNFGITAVFVSIRGLQGLIDRFGFSNALNYFFIAQIILHSISSAGLKPTPYWQLRKKGLTDSATRRVLRDLHLNEPAPLQADDQSTCSLLQDSRVLTAMYINFSVFGCYLAVSQSLPILLTQEFKASVNTAATIGALGSLGYISARLINSFAIDYHKKLHQRQNPNGMRMFTIGSIITCLCCLAFAASPWLFERPLSQLPINLLINVGFSFGLTTAYILMKNWSDDPAVPAYNQAHVIGMMGTVGSLGGPILTFSLALLASKFDTHGIQAGFALYAGVLLLGQWLVSKQNRHILSKPLPPGLSITATANPLQQTQKAASGLTTSAPIRV